MIFATVGSNPWFDFNRFLDGLESIPGDDLVVQYGPGRRPAHAHRAVPWMSFPEMLDHFTRASHVVGHAGAGTILSAVRAGHVPVILPRLRRFREAVDDHQLYLARALSETGRVMLVESPDHLAAALREAPARGSLSTPPETSLVAAIRAELAR